MSLDFGLTFNKPVLEGLLGTVLFLGLLDEAISPFTCNVLVDGQANSE